MSVGVTLGGETAICGAGTTEVGRFEERTALSLAHDAVNGALGDAGIARSAIDGLIVHIGSPRGVDYDEIACLLGLRVRFASQTWSHGRFGATVLTHAAMAVASGMADFVLCLGSYKNSNLGLIGSKKSWGFDETIRQAWGPHSETPHAGFSGPVASAGFVARRYFHKYGHTLDKLSAVPLTLRRHAQLNAHAWQRKPMTFDDYMEAPYIVEPLRLLDCSNVVDGAVAFIVTRADRARDHHAVPVYLLGAQGVHAGPDEFIFGQPGLGVGSSTSFDAAPEGAGSQVYQMTGLSPKDVDLLQIYDAFSPLVLLALERFGFCDVGEAADFVQNGRIGLGGEIPVNTGGGMLSEGHLNGWSQIMEIVRQLRNECGPRQVASARIAQWATALGDSIIFGNEQSR
jgi:acetyl-CoA acetyltransferase